MSVILSQIGLLAVSERTSTGAIPSVDCIAADIFPVTPIRLTPDFPKGGPTPLR